MHHTRTHTPILCGTDRAWLVFPQQRRDCTEPASHCAPRLGECLFTHRGHENCTYTNNNKSVRDGQHTWRRRMARGAGATRALSGVCEEYGSRACVGKCVSVQAARGMSA